MNFELIEFTRVPEKKGGLTEGHKGNEELNIYEELQLTDEVVPN